MSGLIGISAIIAAWVNYTTWAVYRDDNGYYYNGGRSGWWALFWTAVAAAAFWKASRP